MRMQSKNTKKAAQRKQCQKKKHTKKAAQREGEGRGGRGQNVLDIPPHISWTWCPRRDERGEGERERGERGREERERRERGERRERKERERGKWGSG